MDSIEYYNKYAAKVFEDTVDQDMTEIMKEFFQYLEEGATILDLGCGSGRDSLAFYEMGFDVTPLDASQEMCKLAEIHTGLEVLQMSYEEMEFDEAFDGIWACASLVHVPKSEIVDVLGLVTAALKPGGVLYMSFRLGDFEGFRGERYFTEYTQESMEEIVDEVGRLELVKMWETGDVRRKHADNRWLNVLASKK